MDKMTTKEAKELVDEIGGEWFHETPKSLIDLARALSQLGMLRPTVVKMIERIITDMRREYGE
jgi:hypothetical protein